MVIDPLNVNDSEWEALKEINTVYSFEDKKFLCIICDTPIVKNKFICDDCKMKIKEWIGKL